MNSHFPRRTSSTATAEGQGLFDVSYREGTIGADTVLRAQVEAAFEQLAEARQRRFGRGAYLTAIAGFKRDFAIGKTQPWTVMWDWPAHRAAEILNYLDGRLQETAGGH